MEWPVSSQGRPHGQQHSIETWLIDIIRLKPLKTALPPVTLPMGQVPEQPLAQVSTGHPRLLARKTCSNFSKICSTSYELASRTDKLTIRM
ncbi:hypothetical protein PGTUg99_003865 [Puccinia graminis f. sp. tritici]|uniref:Uncharacterized protein n=1 Tax=Puccinia graminis f. sp. tritici TaxID=56615 RepID=A0A5B0RRV7_PUCGR|nr:hypothetical protein PGTUg99_007115 [Puccinia graminis f. sp. tritici]KAA1128307.1 hypothetical protein PGTUg99_003865 [Puccinia graminis f. sp. tritici]